MYYDNDEDTKQKATNPIDKMVSKKIMSNINKLKKINESIQPNQEVEPETPMVPVTYGPKMINDVDIDGEGNIVPKKGVFESKKDNILNLDLEAVKNLPQQNREDLISYIHSVLTSYQTKDRTIQKLLDKVESNFPVDGPGIMESSVSVMLLSKLLDNSEALTRDITRLTKLLAELTVQWEAIDANKENEDDDISSLSNLSEDIDPLEGIRDS